MTELNQDPGPGKIQSAPAHAGDDALGGRHLDLPSHDLERLGVLGVEPADLGVDVHRAQRHREHTALGPQEPPHDVEGADMVAELLPQRHDEQVADDVAVHLALAGEAVLEDTLPGAAPLVLAAQRGERHPQVTGRQDAELAAQPARRAAVVGHGDHRGQVVHHHVVDEVAQRTQGGVQAVPATERHHGLSPVEAAGRDGGVGRERVMGPDVIHGRGPGAWRSPGARAPAGGG